MSVHASLLACVTFSHSAQHNPLKNEEAQNSRNKSGVAQHTANKSGVDRKIALQTPWRLKTCNKRGMARPSRLETRNARLIFQPLLSTDGLVRYLNIANQLVRYKVSYFSLWRTVKAYSSFILWFACLVRSQREKESEFGSLISRSTVLSQII